MCVPVRDRGMAVQPGAVPLEIVPVPEVSVVDVAVAMFDRPGACSCRSVGEQSRAGGRQDAGVPERHRGGLAGHQDGRGGTDEGAVEK